jgi:carotenoid cleavage dioxygenase-like enzyme
MALDTQLKPIISGNRLELDVELSVLEGFIPDDIYGHVFICNPSGSVNSGGLPFPKYYKDGSINNEYGSPIMNGDGFVFRISFDEPGKVKFKSRLLKTPCYYSDEASRRGTIYHKQKLRFYNFGIARISPVLGARNFLNTAIIPYQIKSTNPFLLITYDIGRPYVLDPFNLKLISPVGGNNDWVSATPNMVKMPFKILNTTAHPSFDPHQKLLYSVNFIKKTQSILLSIKLYYALHKVLDKYLLLFPAKLKKVYKDNKKYFSGRRFKIISPFSNLRQFIKKTLDVIKSKVHVKDNVYVVVWDETSKLKKWRLVDKEGKPLVIKQCIHQTAVTKDYFLIIDSSFKFSLDILINNTFPNHPRINKLIKEALSRPMEPVTNLYLVKKTDLKEGASTAYYSRIKQPLPLECVHFAADCENPDDKITIYTAHNSAACLADWIRTHDTLALKPGHSVDPDLLGMFAVGQMDIGRIGKFVVDVNSNEIVYQNILLESGELKGDDFKLPNGHTWGIGLHTYNGILNPHKILPKIKNIYWQCLGADSRMLTSFIFNLYKDYRNRHMSVDDVLKFTKNGVPTILSRLNCEKMEFEDFYRFNKDCNLRAFQFVPKKNIDDDDSIEGYIICMMINLMSGKKYNREIWIFDASNLKSGPLCKFGHEKLDYAFPLHSCWLPEIKPEKYKGHIINAREDFDPIIQKFYKSKKRRFVSEFFEEHVYPNFSDSVKA